MKEVLVHAKEMVPTMSGPRGTVTYKKAEDITAGDHIWTFVADSYSPLLQGYFKFLPVTGPPSLTTKKTLPFKWFNKKDGPDVRIPSDFNLIAEGVFVGPVSSKKQYVGLSNPGYLHDHIPIAIDLELFSDCFTSKRLTEEAAYFLGAFAVRPQCYIYKGETWGVFASHLNASGAYGVSSLPRQKAAQWLSAHRDALVLLAEKVWGRGNFFVEQDGDAIGLPNIGPWKGHQSDCLMRGAAPAGFAIHAPISRTLSLATKGQTTDPDLRVIQYWYACIASHLRERATVSTQKAFLLGALDTVSNADSDRESIGLDFREGFAGEFPMYSALHAIGRKLLETFETDETSNPREADGRQRGRIVRCRIEEELRRVGFISELRFARAAKYCYGGQSPPAPSCHTPSALGVILGTPVLTTPYTGTIGATEEDLTEHKLFRAEGRELRQPFVALPIEEENAYPVSSLPLGFCGTMSEEEGRRGRRAAVGNLLVLSAADWETDALEKIQHLNDYLCTVPPEQRPPEDMVFEYLIAVMASRLHGCQEAWVVPRHEDEGIDVGANFGVGPKVICALFQAKLQSKPVTRRTIDSVRGALHRENGVVGFLVTSSSFSENSRRSAENDWPKVHTIDGKTLVHMLEELGAGIELLRRNRRALNISFFEKLREVVVATRSQQGKILLALSERGEPYSPTRLSRRR